MKFGAILTIMHILSSSASSPSVLMQSSIDVKNAEEYITSGKLGDWYSEDIPDNCMDAALSFINCDGWLPNRPANGETI